LYALHNAHNLLQNTPLDVHNTVCNISQSHQLHFLWLLECIYRLPCFHKQERFVSRCWKLSSSKKMVWYLKSWSSKIPRNRHFPDTCLEPHSHWYQSDLCAPETWNFETRIFQEREFNPWTPGQSSWKSSVLSLNCWLKKMKKHSFEVKLL